MPQFEYQVKDQEGRNLTGIQEASDLNSLVATLREKNLIIIRVTETKKKATLFAGGKQPTGKRGKIKIDDLVVFARQLATMVEAGVPLVQALSILSEQSENINLQRVTIDMHDSVESGKSLSEALEKNKKVFSNFFISMVNAGESSGRLDEILDRLPAGI